MTRDEKIAKLKILKNDFFQYAKLNLKIKTKEGKILPLEFNDPQIYIHEQLEQQLATTGKIRALILKGRQQGASTYTEGRFYWRTSLNFGKQAYILTHEQAATDNLFNMAKRYHDNGHPGLKPSTGASNAKEMLFDRLDSGYKVGTAGSKAVGRSGTIQYFHASEAAFWPNAHEHFAGVVQCVPDGDEAGGTEIIIESTANGVGGKFHELWMQAINGESEYIAIFVPWFWTKGYRKDATHFKPTEEELRQQKLYGVDNEQLAWRRAKIEEMGKALCDQEYPYCWQDAFLASGRTVFDKEETASALKECFSPKKRMILENKRFIERKDGELRVWSEPQAGKRYVIGADVAEGLEHGDYSSADVLELPSGIQVAQWHGHIAPDLYGHMLNALGKWFNSALLGVEANNHGLTTLVTLRDLNYPNLYVQHNIDDRGSNEKETKKLGWATTSKSKPYIIDQLSAELREGEHGICCKETVQEMQTYVVLENGSYGAQLNCFDDRVMSRAIAGEMLRQSPSYKKK
jgi:hypothetical protein